MQLQMSVKTKHLGKLAYEVLFYQDNNAVQKALVSMTALFRTGWSSQPPILLIWRHLTLICSATCKNTLGWEPLSQCWWPHIWCCWPFGPTEWNLLRQWNPSNATAMEELCEPKKGLCWKINLIWSHSMILSWSIFQPTFVSLVRGQISLS